jgi:hypothetical protein
VIVRIEYEVTVADPEETEKAWRALARELLPRKWDVKEVQFCSRLAQRGPTEFEKVRVIRVLSGEATS